MGKDMRRVKGDWETRANNDILYWVYNVHGRRSRDWHACYEGGRQQARRLAGLLLHHSGIDPRDKSILDIGCGVGRLFPGFADLGFHPVYGVDISATMIERGKAECPVADADFHVVNGEDLSPIGSESIDCCFSYNVFAHFPERRTFWAYMEEIERVLRPGGWLQIHFRGSSTRKQRFFRILPERLREPVRVAYRAASFKWLGGAGIKAKHNESALSETLDLGRAIAPRDVSKRLSQMGFDCIEILPDLEYLNGNRFWVIARKTPTH